MHLGNLRSSAISFKSLQQSPEKWNTASSLFRDVLTKRQVQAKQEHLLAQTALRICTSFNPLEILSCMVAEIHQLLKVERVIVYRLQADGNGVVLAESLEDYLPTLLNQTITDPCCARNWLNPEQWGQSQAIRDVSEAHLSPAYFRLLKSLNIRAQLVVPIAKYSKKTLEQKILSLEEKNSKTLGRQLWGFISIQNCSGPRDWQADEIDFLQKLSTHVAIALQQAELSVGFRAAMMQHQRAIANAQRVTTQHQQPLLDKIAKLKEKNEGMRREIIKRNQLVETLFQEKELSQLTIESIHDAVITTDLDGVVQSMNPAAERLTGWSFVHAQGQPLAKVFQIIDEGTKTPQDCPAQRALQSRQAVCLPSQSLFVAKDGKEYMIDDSISPIFDRDRQLIGTVLVFHDVTQSRQLEKLLSWQASHDPLTGLINRREFEKQIEATLELVQNNDQPHVLCYFDLDRFKVINDTCGHLAGDQLLKQITSVIHQRIRTSDTLARLGGDEFGLLLHHCSLDHAQKITEDLIELIQNYQFLWEGQRYHVGVSMGLAAVDKHSKDLVTLLSAADSACYQAKNQGGNNVQIYQAIEAETGKSDHYWVGQVYSAIEEDRLQLYSQKISALTQTSEFDMSEVLLRFIDPQGQLLLPESLILAAEKFHLTHSIDQWVVKTFCEAYHQQTLPNPLLYTINLSGESLNKVPFIQFLVDQIQQNQVPPDRICFEITETAAIKNLAKASELIHSIKQLGCRFALDDFGSGMSSLAYLKALPVDYLKIDGAFIQQLASNPIDGSIVECFNRLSHDMGIKTIAEWVEDEPTLEKLKEIGVDYVQGFGVSMPAPLLLL